MAYETFKTVKQGFDKKLCLDFHSSYFFVLSLV